LSMVWSSQWEHLVGGLAGGVASTIVCHPLDLLKIRYSANEGDSRRPQYRSYWHATRSIVSSKGPLALYQGLSPNLLGAALSWGLYFQLFHITTKQMRVMDLGSGAGQNFLAGILSGCSIMLLTNPIWVVKTRLCLQYETLKGNERRYNGMFHCLRLIYRDEGIRGLYKGLLPGLIGTSHGAVQLMIYTQLKENRAIQLGLDSSTGRLATRDYLLFSALSKMIATTVTFPYQVVRTRLQDHHVHYEGVMDVLRRTMRNEGLTGFYKGLLAANVRQLPAALITFVTYEQVVHLLRR